jgi:hypothetical protein
MSAAKPIVTYSKKNKDKLASKLRENLMRRKEVKRHATKEKSEIKK